ncbi:uncharacterized protein BX663DRAFT_459008 [Cokeromyces recurvatus]|uniref:uncharacterized protein n=1 Tax=Cokeromyces recurvatus TaxID=90255 RepID=UPI0022204979|nr:uncharacterized protein BX663DRAFT_459008 [Cokeromyces recurvatus]KAI7900361.1 hypothetical protein BX663DRAFT_459008 [Cokeromyces recurvatus]
MTTIAFKEYIINYVNSIKGSVTLKNFINDEFEFIVSNTVIGEDLKSVWSHRLVSACREMNKELKKSDPDWSKVAMAVLEREHNKNSNASNPSTVIDRRNISNTESSLNATSQISASSSNATSKQSFQQTDKDKLLEVFNQLDKKKFWYLEASKNFAKENNTELKSVEEKMLIFALQCNYIHPCHSFILDLNDQNWNEVFTNEELMEIDNYGTPIIRKIDEKISAEFDKLEKLTSLNEIYDHVRNIDHCPVNDPLIAWLSLTVTTLSLLFLQKDSRTIHASLESDQLYRLWFFLNTIFDSSSIKAIGKEKSSYSNSNAKNAKRKIAAIEEMASKKMGRKIDTIYAGDNFEFGALEIGSKDDQTKEIKDGSRCIE